MKYVLVLTLGMLGVACAPTLQQQRKDGLAAATTDRERGEIYYRTSCNRCHALYMPSSFTPREWPRIVKRYGPRARLSPEQRQLVLDFLTAASAESENRR
jgi:hypothetical protein